MGHAKQAEEEGEEMSLANILFAFCAIAFFLIMVVLAAIEIRLEEILDELRKRK